MAFMDEFLQSEYLIAPSRKSQDMVNAGVISETLTNADLDKIILAERNIKPNGEDNLVTKLFLLAYPYAVRERDGLQLSPSWESQLGFMEYKVGQLQRFMAVKRRLFEKAIAHLQDAITGGYCEVQNYSVIGHCYLNLGQFNDALINLLEAEKRGNASTITFSKIGWCYMGLNDFSNALVYLKKAEAGGDDSYEVQSGLGRCYFRLRNYDDSLRHYKNAREKGDKTFQNASNIARCYYRLDDFESALQWYEESARKGNNSDANRRYIQECKTKLARA